MVAAGVCDDTDASSRPAMAILPPRADLVLTRR
jgi:hypothetical protein